MMRDCEQSLARFPHTLEANRWRLQSAESPRMREILRVVCQEQEVLHKAMELVRPHLRQS